MKAPSKIAIVALALNLLLPTASLAQGGDDSPSSSPEVHTSEMTSPSPSSTSGKRTEGVKVTEASKFCTSMSSFQTDISGNIKDKVEKLKSNFDDRSSKMLQKRTELTAKISANRLKADIERTKKFAELEAKAKTASQIAAVKDYESAVLAAVAKHRAAIDSADKTFLDGVTVSVTSRQAQLTALSLGYQSGVAIAAIFAKTSCASGVAPATVRKQFTTTIKTLQSKISEARSKLEMNRPNLDVLKDAHKAAIKQANAEFRSALKDALTKLKAALVPAEKTSTDEARTEATGSPAPSASPVK